MLPNFVVIGSMNAGTTSLYHYLRAHPDVFMARNKELSFFAAEQNWERGPQWYEAQFEDADGATAVGEASVIYSMHPVFDGVAERMASVIPDAKLIYLVRDPIERMQTQYLNYRFPKRIRRLPSRTDGLLRRPFDDHLFALSYRREPRRIGSALLESPLYLNCSRYAHQIERFMTVFDRDQLLVITSEGLRDNRAETMRRAYAFLGVDPDFSGARSMPEFHRTSDRRVARRLGWTLNRVPGYRSLERRLPLQMKRLKTRLAVRRADPAKAVISDDVRRELQARLRDDVRRLRDFVDGPFDGWGIA